MGKEPDTFTGKSLKVRLYTTVVYARRDERESREPRPGGETNMFGVR